MKLLRLSISPGYRALHGFEQQFETRRPKHGSIEPICLAGLNGSGKSQLLELLADIFSAAVLALPPYRRAVSEAPIRLPEQFSVEYLLERYSDPVHVRIERIGRQKLSFARIVDGDPIEVMEEADIPALLPDRIVGYTSGENETLSQPFYIIQEQYAELVRDRAYLTKGRRTFPAKREQVLRNPVPNPRTLFVNYDMNSLLVVSNFLMGDQRALQFQSDRLNLESLRSFRIVIRFDKNRPGAQRPIDTTPEIDDVVGKLISCAPVHRVIEPGQAWVLDYYVSDATRSAFQKVFGTARELFIALYQLSQLNALSIPKSERKFYYRRGDSLKILTRPPTVPPEEMVFRIESIQWSVKGSSEPLQYVDLSDGEHQYLLVMGTLLALDEEDTLFLLDEPDTHFNPLWRARLVSDVTNMLNIRPSAEGPMRDYLPQIILTTHAPFIISDCRGDNVYWFSRNVCNTPTSPAGGLKPSVEFRPTAFETYGSSYQYILHELFDMPHLVGHQALEDFDTQLEAADELDELHTMADVFGESAEKIRLYEKIATIEHGDEQ